MPNPAWWSTAYFFGMGSQAAISAMLFPDGIDPAQQLLAAILFGFLALIFAVVAVALDRRSGP